MQLSDLSETLLPRLKRMLPMILMLVLASANAMICGTSVLPAARLYDAASVERDSAKATLESMNENSDASVMLRVLNRQITAARADLEGVGNNLLTETQADELIERLYWYADRAGVQVISLQSQESVAAPNPATADGTAVAATALPLELRFLRLQVQGEMPHLISYVTNLREASMPAVLLEALDLTQGTGSERNNAAPGVADQATLTISLTLYTSPFASGLILTQIPTLLPFTPQQSSSVEVALLGEATPTGVATLVPTIQPTASSTPTATNAPTSTPTSIPTARATEGPTAIPSATPSEELIRLASMEEPPVDVLFEETFDNDPLYAWTLDNGWTLVGVANGRALQAATGTTGEVILRYDALGDAVIQMRFLLESGSMNVRLRGSIAGNYTIEINDANVLTLYRGEVPIQTAVYPGTIAGQWHTLRFSAFSNILRLAVDGTEQMIAFDSLSLPPGDISISNGGGVLYVDDVTVWTAAVPTAVPTEE